MDVDEATKIIYQNPPKEESPSTETPTTTAKQAKKKFREQLEDKSPVERLQLIMMEISDESDALREIRETFVGDDASVVSARRVTALKEMGNLILQLDKIGMDINLNHPILGVLMGYLLDKFIQVLRANGLPQSQTDVILSALYADIQGWEKEVDVRYRAHCKEQMMLGDREREKRIEKKGRDKQREQLKAVS